jgi:uncharacterized membrane protein SpoIIM required for sporulation
MDERAFVERRRPEWVRLEDMLKRTSSGNLHGLSRTELMDLGKLYRRVTSDLSYVKSNTSNQDIILYLNDLAGRAHGLLYADAPRNLGRSIVTFLLRGFPILFRAHGRMIAISSAIFLLSAFFAAGMVAHNPKSFNKLVPAMLRGADDSGADDKLGPDEDKGIATPASFSSGIMTNNIFVSIRAFAGGVTFGVWTVRELVENGKMLGALGMRFSRKPKVALRFWSLILPHGIIELLAIAIAGGAGLILGWSLISPGNLTRWDSLRLASRQAAPLMGGVIGMLVVAGMIEGFITPSPLDAWTKLAFAGVTAIGCVLYFGLAGRDS